MTFIATSRKALPLSVLALAFALTACGGASSPAAKSKDPAAKSTSTAGNSGSKGATGLCKLISQGEAQDAVGQPLATGVSTSGQTPAGFSGGCKYLGTTVNTKTNGKGVVQVIILGTKLTRAQYDEATASEGKIGAEAGAKPVPGLGETAFYVPGLVTLFDRGLAMTVQVVKADRSPVDAAVIIKLARQALDRSGDLR